MKKIAIIGLLALTAGFGTATAQEAKTDKSHELIISDKAGWHKIGEVTADFKKEKEEVVVLGADRFASIRFKVTDAPIDLQSLEVFYESGDKQVVKVNTAIKSPGESRTIELNGGERTLKKIVFVYKTLPNHKDEKAHVEIWGMKTNVAGM
jgi:predicted house-cleaning NTP pyrophosphatase (Maf/HAM1 superfamily)